MSIVQVAITAKQATPKRSGLKHQPLYYSSQYWRGGNQIEFNEALLFHMVSMEVTWQGLSGRYGIVCKVQSHPLACHMPWQRQLGDWAQLGQSIKCLSETLTRHCRGHQVSCLVAQGTKCSERQEAEATSLIRFEPGNGHIIISAMLYWAGSSRTYTDSVRGHTNPTLSCWKKKERICSNN